MWWALGDNDEGKSLDHLLLLDVGFEKDLGLVLACNSRFKLGLSTFCTQEPRVVFLLSRSVLALNCGFFWRFRLSGYIPVGCMMIYSVYK